jgi:thioredoxin type arsenate reductase
MTAPSGPPAAFITAPPRHVLFLCIHNSARSQIAEGFARALAPAGAEIWSAGTEPTHVHPLAVEVMQEIGIDIRGQRSRRLDQVPWREADTVVTLCGEADEACPVLAGDVRRVRWPLPDPAAAPEPERREAFRACRDEIRWRMGSLWPGAGK